MFLRRISVTVVFVIAALLCSALNGAYAATQYSCDPNYHTIKACFNLMSDQYRSAIWTTSYYGVVYRIDFGNTVGNTVKLIDLTNNIPFTLTGTLTFGASTSYDFHTTSGLAQDDYMNFYLDGQKYFIKTAHQRTLSWEQEKLFCVNNTGSACQWGGY